MKGSTGSEYTDDPARQYAAPRLTGFGGWVIIGAMVYAPWAFGSRSYLHGCLLSAQLFLAAALWAVGYATEKRWPRLPGLCVALTLGLLVYSWCAWFNGASVYYAPRDLFVPTGSYVRWLPSTADAANSLQFLGIMSAVLLMVPAVADLSRYPRWRHRFFVTAALTGASVVVVGLMLKAGAAPALVDYMAHRPWAHGVVFGPFDYHGNAGNFFNLTLPAAALCAGWARTPLKRGAWLAIVGLFYLAMLVNLSRTALVIGVFSVPLNVWIFRGANRQAAASAAAQQKTDAAGGRRGSAWRVGIVVGVVAVISALAAVVAVKGGAKSVQRMQKLPQDIANPWYARYMQNRAAWEVFQRNPVFGTGTGSYKLLVQHTSIRGNYFAPKYWPGKPFTVLSHTKEDYLQTLAEWGVVGFAGWAALVGGAFATLGWSRLKVGGMPPTAFAAGTALLGLYVHALDDCPLQIPALQFYAALYLGLAWGRMGWMQPPKAEDAALRAAAPLAQAPSLSLT